MWWSGGKKKPNKDSREKMYQNEYNQRALSDMLIVYLCDRKLNNVMADLPEYPGMQTQAPALQTWLASLHTTPSQVGATSHLAPEYPVLHMQFVVPVEAWWRQVPLLRQ
jgi:hypothetical protein